MFKRFRGTEVLTLYLPLSYGIDFAVSNFLMLKKVQYK